MRHTCRRLLTVGILIGCALGVWYATPARQFFSGRPSGPALEAPSSIEWGQVEVYGIVAKEIVLRNVGDAPLYIQGFRTTCGCLGLETRVGDQYVPVREARLSPGEEYRCTVRMEARGDAGTSIRQRITFLTNDPRHPEFSIDGFIHEVTGGVTAVPSTVFAGELLPGATSETDFDILDGAAVARRLDHLEAPSPHTVSVVSTQSQDVWVEGKRVGARIGRGHVNSVAPLQPGPFSYKVSIYLRDVARQPDVLEIHGVVKPAVKFQPSALMLPRATPNGPVYRRTVRLTNNLPKDCVVAVKDAPPHLRLALPALLKAGQSLEIEVSADVPPAGKPVFGELQILATSGKDYHEQSVRYRITQ